MSRITRPAAPSSRGMVGKAITTPWQCNCACFSPHTVRCHETCLVP